MKVKTFNDKELKEAIKSSDPIIQQYIKAQKNIIDMIRRDFAELKIKYIGQYHELTNYKLQCGVFNNMLANTDIATETDAVILVEKMLKVSKDYERV